MKYPVVEVIELIDFQDYPILTLEQDEDGNHYLSYLAIYEGDNEVRCAVYVSNERLSLFKGNKISLQEIFNTPEKGNVFIIRYNMYTGDLISENSLTTSKFIELKCIPEDYVYVFSS